jgi:serine/threonine protein phosphatase PrpC
MLSDDGEDEDLTTTMHRQDTSLNRGSSSITRQGTNFSGSHNQIYQKGRWEITKQKQSIIKKALHESFIKLNELVSNQTDRDFNTQMSGATLTVLLLSDDDILYVASVGDSRAALF